MRPKICTLCGPKKDFEPSKRAEIYVCSVKVFESNFITKMGEVPILYIKRRPTREMSKLRRTEGLAVYDVMDVAKKTAKIAKNAKLKTC